MDTNDILSTTTNTIYRMMQEKNGGDCLLLYFRYMIQGRIQNTSNTLSNDKFMMKATGWGRDRFQKAKSYLISTNTIEPIVRRDEGGVIVGHFIRVKYDIGNTISNGLECPQPGIPTSGPSPHVGVQLPNTIVENNINTIVENIETPDISSLDLSFMEDEVPKIVKTRKPRNNNIDIIISAFKSSLASKGYSYVNIKERMMAMHLSNNAEWKVLVEESGGCSDELIKMIMEWSLQDAFWNGKISSLQVFYYKWGMLVNRMKTEGKFRRLNAKEDNERKLAALHFFENL